MQSYSHSNFKEDPIVQDLNLGRSLVVWLQLGGRIFFQTSNFDSLQLWHQLTYREPHYLFGKISTSLTNSVSIERKKRIFNTSFAPSKWPHLHRAYVIGGCISIWLPVPILDKPFGNGVTLRDKNNLKNPTSVMSLKYVFKSFISFQWGIVSLFRSKGCKAAVCQTWRMIPLSGYWSGSPTYGAWMTKQQFLFKPPTLTSHNFVALSLTETHSTSFE